MEENDLQLIEETKSYVNSTCKWYRFFGVMTIIGAVLLFLSGIFMVAAPSVMTQSYGSKAFYDYDDDDYGFGNTMYYSSSSARMTRTSLEASKAVFIASGITYIIFSLIMIFPVLFLFRAARAGTSAITRCDNAEISGFLKNTKSYWKFYGIFTIVLLSILLLSFILGVAAAAASF